MFRKHIKLLLIIRFMDIQIYKKEFTRDFCLIYLETWFRGESTASRQWTKNKQPFFPYIIFEQKQGIVRGYYNPQGIGWAKEELIALWKKDPKFPEKVAKTFIEKTSFLEPIAKEMKTLNKKELEKYILHLTDFWPWFEAIWWFIIKLEELKQENSEAMEILKDARLRGEKTTGNSSEVIEKSLELLYPQYKKYSRVISSAEAISGKLPSKSELERRVTGYFYTADKLFTGLSKQEIESKFNIKFEDKTRDFSGELKGSSVYPGIAKGRVRKVLDRNQLRYFKEGEILVSPTTLPYFISAMKKASAIISDEGGVICHAAIVARELKKPCVIGVKIATDVLNNGDLVEVDANKGIVKIIKRAKP